MNINTQELPAQNIKPAYLIPFPAVFFGITPDVKYDEDK
jgi:hypothetical protein